MALQNLSVNIGANTTGFSKGIKTMQDGIKSLNSGIRGFAENAKSLTSLTIPLTALGVSMSAFGKKSVESAVNMQNAYTGLNSILNGQGRSFAQAQAFITSYTKDGLIPATEAITAYKNLALRGYDDSQIHRVMVALKDSAAFGRQASYSLGQAVASASEGLKNENSILVDNAGVTKNVAKMWDDYAKSIGTTSNNLTQQQKIQAEVNGILEETKYQSGDAAKISGSFSGKVSQLKTSFEMLKVSIGNAVIPFAEALLPVVAVAVAGFTKLSNAFGGLNSTAKTFLGISAGLAISIPLITLATKGLAFAKLLLATAYTILIPKVITFGAVLKASLGWLSILIGAIGIISAITGGSARDTSKMDDAFAGAGQSAISASSGVDGMTDSLKTLKKAQKGLTGFDEVNTLGSAESDSNNGLMSDMLGSNWQADYDKALQDISALQQATSTPVRFKINGDTAYATLNKINDFSRFVFGSRWNDFWQSVGKAVSRGFSDSDDKAFGVLSALNDSTRALFGEQWTAYWQNAGKNVHQAFEKEKNPVIGVFAGMNEGIRAIFGNEWVLLWEKAGADTSKAFTNTKIGVEKLFSNWGPYWQNVGAKVRQAFANEKNPIVKVFSGVNEGVRGIFGNGWVTFWQNKGASLAQTFRNAGNKVKSDWKGVGTYFSGVWSNIKGAFGNVSSWFTTTFTKAWTGVKNVFSKGGKVFDGIKDGILNGLKAVVNALIKGINKVISVPFNGINSSLKKIKGVNILGAKPFNFIDTINVPEIPMLARGGIIDSPTVAMVGEAGKEAVMPLENNTGWIDQLAVKIAGIMGGMSGSQSSPSEIILNMDGNTFARATIPYLDKEKSRQGSISRTVRVVTT